MIVLFTFSPYMMERLPSTGPWGTCWGLCLIQRGGGGRSASRWSAWYGPSLRAHDIQSTGDPFPNGSSPSPTSCYVPNLNCNQAGAVS